MQERNKCPKCNLKHTYRLDDEKWHQDLIKCIICNFEMWVPKAKKRGE